jgi:hypothetical protein
MAQALIDGQSEALTQTLIQMALERDPVAMRLSMERILPPRKDRPVSFQLRPIGSARDAAEAQSDIAAVRYCSRRFIGQDHTRASIASSAVVPEPIFAYNQ